MFNSLLELPLVAHSCGLVAAARACTIQSVITEVISSARHLLTNVMNITELTQDRDHEWNMQIQYPAQLIAYIKIFKMVPQPCMPDRQNPAHLLRLV